MKSFAELVERVFNERFYYVVDKIVAEKTPVAFLSNDPIEEAVQTVNGLRDEGLNIVSLVITPPPRVPATSRNLTDEKNFSEDFEIVSLEEISKVTSQVKYIFTADKTIAKTASRIVSKYAKECKGITLNSGRMNYTRGKSADESEFIRLDKNIAIRWHKAFMNYLPELYEIYESLIDDESKKAFCGYWLGSTSNQFDKFVYSNTPQYFHEGFLPKKDDVVIDCGVAAEARNSIQFSGMGCKVYGFEMDSLGYEKAKPITKKHNNITLENLALGSYKTNVHYRRFKHNPDATHFDNLGSEVAQLVTLDDYVSENKIPRVDFIKMDVEGAELDILKGATATIARFKPTFLLSAYHKVDDLWVFVKFLKSIRPDYKFALRHSSFTISGAYGKYLISLGLKPVYKYQHGELVLFAR